MFVELIDQLRCPAPHEESWLVLFADESRDRHILRGTLGCPVCGARYPIEGGTVWFVDADGGNGTGAGNGTDATHSDGDAAAPALPPMAIAAYLDLAEPGGIVALFGAWAAAAEELGDIVERVELVAIAPRGPTHPMQSGIVPPSRTRVPLAPGAMRAAAVDVGDDAALVVIEAARLVRSGGRILAPASTPIPAGVREIARDARWWIGEREGGSVSGIISLSARRLVE